MVDHKCSDIAYHYRTRVSFISLLYSDMSVFGANAKTKQEVNGELEVLSLYFS